MGNCFGRTEELTWLRGMWEQCATRDASTGDFGGPRMAIIVAESGYGKSRLVQELYHQLSTDERWDPPEANYWPDAFQTLGEQLRVNPDHTDHVPEGPPRFLWLGMRWRAPDARNSHDRVSAIPDARDALRIHTQIWQSQGPLWKHALNRLFEAAPGELAGQVADWVVPSGSALWKLLKGGIDIVRDRSQPVQSYSECEEKHLEDAAELFESQLREVFDHFNLPTVLWLDDAQWIDPTTVRVVRLLWEEGCRKRWPLFVIATRFRLECGSSIDALRNFEGTDGVAVRELSAASAADMRSLVSSHFPGLTPSQLDLVIEKAAGNYLRMVENLGELRSTTRAFEGRDLGAAMTPAYELVVRRWTIDRSRRIQQRFD